MTECRECAGSGTRVTQITQQDDLSKMIFEPGSRATATPLQRWAFPIPVIAKMTRGVTPCLRRTCGMMRWKMLPLKVRGLPDWPMPFSPVHRARKFSTVFGTVLPYRPITMRPCHGGEGQSEGWNSSGTQNQLQRSYRNISQ